MQDHEKTLITLVLIGALIGFAKLLVSDEPLRWRVVVGRTILGSATASIAGLILLQVPDVSPIVLIASACALGILGSTYIEELIKRNAKKWGG